MKILHVTREAGSDVRYGIRKSLQPVLEAMLARGHEVTLFDQAMARGYPLSAADRGAAERCFRRYRMLFGKGNEFFADVVRERAEMAWAAARHARQAGVSHVHFHDPLMARAYQSLSRRLSLELPWGYTAHAFGRYVQAREGFPLPDAVARHMQLWEHEAAREAHWVVAPSRSGLERMARDLGWAKPPANWHAIPHPKPQLPRTDGAEVRRRLGVGDGMLVLAMGQLTTIKRFDLLVEVVGGLPQPLPHLLILGEGPEEARLRLLATQHGLAELIHLESTDDVAPFLAAADVYVSLSSTEAYGMANCEAVAAGLPAVCSAVGAVPEVLGDGAWLVGESIDEIVGAVSRLLTSPTERATLAARARQRASNWWSAEQVAVAMEEIFAAGSPG